MVGGTLSDYVKLCDKTKVWSAVSQTAAVQLNHRVKMHASVAVVVLCIVLSNNGKTFASNEILDVTIEVDYDPPSTFHRTSENDFQAGSSVTLTCLVNGVNQLGLLYEWSSTCTGNCFAKWQTTSSISTHYLRSYDSGVHTCVVYDGVGHSGNASINMNIIGAGIYVSRGHKVLPNNSIIVTGAGDWIGEFRCLSGSKTAHVGKLISPAEEDVTFSNSDPFLMTRGGAHNSGMLHVRSHSPLSSGDQGVYTCRIPDEDGNILDVNVGLYLNSEAVSPTILSLESDTYQRTLTCKTFGSPPTRITWTLNGETLVTFGSKKYSSSQILLDRMTATYANVLTIDRSVEEAVGEYNCTVSNIIGSDTESTVVKAIEISGHENPIIVGLEGIITCSTHLNVSKMEWFLVGVDDLVEETDNNQTLILSLSPDTTGLDGTMFTCKITTVGGGAYSQTITVAVKDLDHRVTIDGQENPLLAGGSYTFTCTVISDIAPTVKWMGPDGTPVRNNDDDIIVSDMATEGTLTTVTLAFSSLRSSYGGRYSCLSVVDNPPSTKRAARDIIVEIPPPTVTVVRTPSDSKVFTTTDILLTCYTVVDSSIDTEVEVHNTWSGPSVDDSNYRVTIINATGSGLAFQSSVRITSLQSSDSGTYTCSSVVEPSEETSYVIDSDYVNMTTDVNAVLKVTIQISYTPPDQYPDYEPPNYRAASSVTLRCVVEGATGSVSYRWSSTCSSCFAYSSSSSSISESFLRSRDRGTHTCTVTDSIGNRGSDSTQMNIVGAGIYVTQSYSNGGSQAAQPNNTYIQIYNSRYSHSTRISFYCCSNSTSSSVGGSFTLPNGAITSNNYWNFQISQQSGSYSGCIYLYLNYNRYYSYYLNSYGYSGIYTCNIPDINGRAQYVNFGMYDQSYFSSAPIVSGLSHVSSQDSSLTLSCRTTTAPPTSIFWYRDGTEIDIEWSTTRMRQSVTNRGSSYYESTLLIDHDPDDVIGMYTCKAGNNYGTSTSSSVTLEGLQMTTPEVSVVGNSSTLECSSDLDVSSVQWFRDDTLVKTASSTSRSTLTLDPVSSDDHGVEFKCRATSPYGVQERSVVLEITVPDEWATVEITNSNNQNAVDESNYTLICTVTAINIPPNITWFYPNGSIVQSGGNITVGSPLTEGTVTTSTLSFTPVLSEHGGVYTCRADIYIPWMDTQPMPQTASVDMVVTSQEWFQLRMKPVQYCTEWDISKARDLEQWIKKDIEKAVRQRCKCDFFSSAIYSGEFGCRTSKTSVLYRAIINGTSDLHTAGELINFIEDWRTNEGTLLYNMFRLDLTKKAECPLLIGSFNDEEC